MTSGGPREIHICVRRTLDWGDTARVSAELDPGFRQKYEAWNATFDVGYAEFRRQVVEIAECSRARVAAVRVSSLGDVPPAALVVPVDDDDWFAPDLGMQIRRLLDGSHSGCRWHREVIEPLPDGAPIRTWWARRRSLERFVCASNNYAVVNTPTLAPLALDHVRASEYFDAHPGELVRTQKLLAIQNRNPASQTALAWRRPAISRDELVALLERYRGLYARWKLRRALRWAQPYVDRMAELVDAIRVR